jgi:hypothetical protein
VRRLALALAASLAFAGPAAAGQSKLVLWAWERPEDLRFAPAGVEVAAQTGVVELSGDRVESRSRSAPLQMNGRPATAMVHVQIDRRRPLEWTPKARAAAAAAVLELGRPAGSRRLQVDFEVKRSERQVLLDLLGDVRRGLPRNVLLSMTVTASWCDTERWLAGAPVDEIVPMMFGPTAEKMKAKLAAGGDFRGVACRRAVGVSTESPLRRGPPRRRIYLYSPRSWTQADFDEVRRSVASWSSSGD